MTDHPCAGMLKAQIEAFERIAICQPPLCGELRMRELLKRGLVVRGPDIARRDSLGSYTIPSYSVPLPVHYQWCTWAGEQFGEEEIG